MKLSALSWEDMEAACESQAPLGRSKTEAEDAKVDFTGVETTTTMDFGTWGELGTPPGLGPMARCELVASLQQIDTAVPQQVGGRCDSVAVCALQRRWARSTVLCQELYLCGRDTKTILTRCALGQKYNKNMYKYQHFTGHLMVWSDASIYKYFEKIYMCDQFKIIKR